MKKAELASRLRAVLDAVQAARGELWAPMTEARNGWSEEQIARFLPDAALKSVQGMDKASDLALALLKQVEGS